MVQQHASSSTSQASTTPPPTSHKTTLGPNVKPLEFDSNAPYWHYLVGRRLYTQGFAYDAIAVFINGFDQKTVSSYGSWVWEWLQYCYKFYRDPIRPMA